ncbi:hydrogenase maturation protein HypF [Calothrix sp. NIES-4071]|nr:hydrogenase maturation protein HypF [Calothrix sp. NIES-4071]BAZ59498.1 hydrogenase maturation protein HypF [Calothrix sp. NIES-4105]
MYEEIRVRGTVQGVGFRPTVYRIAVENGLCGEVYNDGEGVIIRVSGSQKSLDKFVRQLQQECPPLARINEITRTRSEGEFNFDDFVISKSINNVINTEITPDTATCVQCQSEIFDPQSRWFRYPFTNCTHCGPRLSIIRSIPYDRSNTSMASFAICPECLNLYNDIKNRRFHAQPIACHICGPKAWLERADGKPFTASMFSMLDEVDAVCTLLQKGEIVAIKGLGGVNLACDATNETAVKKLRQRKQRYHKPFALMARDIAVIEKYCNPNAIERELLQSSKAPIVLVRAGDKNYPSLSASVAPNSNTLGFMLPYTGLHHLILKRMNRPIVFTSGNISDEPQCIDNSEAREKLGNIADYFLLHNRDIINRVDDSVVRVVGDKTRIIRRARGYAPASINLPSGFASSPQILAMGGELKSTFCLLRHGKAIISQHLGDLENVAAFNSYQETLDLYLKLFEHKPEAIATDLHPEYLSTKFGKQLAASNQLIEVQHHHAHVAACMAENNVDINTAPVLGIAFDGLGYGKDGTLWGGEFLLANYREFTRVAAFKPVPMIGGALCIHQPWRNTYANLVTRYNWQELVSKYGNLELFQFLQTKPISLLNQLISKQINSPLTSSVGRLFDAVAAAIGICRDTCSYEGQAAIEMEALIDENNKESLSYSFEIEKSNNISYIDSSYMWIQLLDDLQQNIPKQVIAAKFHQGLINIIVQMVSHLRQEYEFNQIALTGGVFQNAILLKQLECKLATFDTKVITHSLVPCNDGGISLGQAVIAAARLIK